MSRRQAHTATTTSALSLQEPTSFTQANKFPQWREAMLQELTALTRNHTWELVPRPAQTNILKNKWLFRIKRNADGSVEHYKARLMAKGFTQQPGLDYAKTFSPVIKFPTIRVVLTLVAVYHWQVRQLDISNAFLHGHLDKDLFMEQPIGFKDATHPDYVCRLRRSLYGLKQAPRAWFERVTRFLLSLGFVQSQADHSLFCYCRPPTRLFVLIYVDDILLTGSTSQALDWLFHHIQKAFPIRDLSDLNYFLGIEVITIV
jgi:hypothetical protein